MPINRDALLDKLDHVQAQLAAAKSKERVIERVGGRTVQTTTEVAFQQMRVDVFLWATDATEAQIRQRLADEIAAIGDGAEDLLEHGDFSGLPEDIVRSVCVATICQFALGEHPALRLSGGDA